MNSRPVCLFAVFRCPFSFTNRRRVDLLPRYVRARVGQTIDKRLSLEVHGETIKERRQARDSDNEETSDPVDEGILTRPPWS